MTFGRARYIISLRDACCAVLLLCCVLPISLRMAPLRAFFHFKSHLNSTAILYYISLVMICRTFLFRWAMISLPRSAARMRYDKVSIASCTHATCTSRSDRAVIVPASVYSAASTSRRLPPLRLMPPPLVDCAARGKIPSPPVTTADTLIYRNIVDTIPST